MAYLTGQLNRVSFRCISNYLVISGCFAPPSPHPTAGNSENQDIAGFRHKPPIQTDSHGSRNGRVYGENQLQGRHPGQRFQGSILLALALALPPAALASVSGPTRQQEDENRSTSFTLSSLYSAGETKPTPPQTQTKALALRLWDSG